MRRRTFLAAAAGTAAALGIAGRGALAAGCTVPAELTTVSARLPRLAATLKARKPATIVAIGGASTYGAAAGGPDRAYPRRLEVSLADFFPGRPIAVLNKGVPRQTAQDMAARFPTDVFARDPVLTIWEAGTVDAVRGIPIDNFAAALQAGIDELKQRSIDIVLVDMQFSAKTTALIDFGRYLDTVHRIGDLNQLYVFPRHAMMRYWSEQNMFNFEEVAERDRASLAAAVYDCLGRQLAAAIRTAVA